MIAGKGYALEQKGRYHRGAEYIERYRTAYREVQRLDANEEKQEALEHQFDEAAALECHAPPLTYEEDSLLGIEYSVQWLYRAISKLDDKHATVIILWYGLNGREPMTMDEIGEQMGLSRERVRQVKDHALRKLRWPGLRAAEEDRQYVKSWNGY